MRSLDGLIADGDADGTFAGLATQIGGFVAAATAELTTLGSGAKSDAETLVGLQSSISVVLSKLERLPAVATLSVEGWT
jgi:hypothetical protein